MLKIISILYLSLATQRGGGPTPEELIRLLEQCDLSTSHASTPCPSPCPSMLGGSMGINRLKASNVAFLNQQHLQTSGSNQASSSGSDSHSQDGEGSSGVTNV